MLELAARSNDTTASPPSVGLRHLEPDDWPAVAEIYWDGMRDGLATFETEVPPWEVWDARHLPDHRLVAELHGEVVGWAALSPAKETSANDAMASEVSRMWRVAGETVKQGL